MIARRILLTGARSWSNYDAIHQAFTRVTKTWPSDSFVLVHGASRGADTEGAKIALEMGWKIEAHPGFYPHYKLRNQKMVNLGADICLCFALSWASGSGQTARMARRAGIQVIDIGVGTE